MISGEISELPRWWSGIEYRYRAPVARVSSHMSVDKGQGSINLLDVPKKQGGEASLMTQPSVRFRKTINTDDGYGGYVAVNAQKYVPGRVFC